MPTMVFGRDREVAAWAERVLLRPLGLMGRAFTWPFVAIGVANDQGALTGAFVLTGFDGNDVNVSVAGRGAIARTPLRTVVDYIFNDLGCARITVTTRVRLIVTHPGCSRKLYSKDGRGL